MTHDVENLSDEELNSRYETAKRSIGNSFTFIAEYEKRKMQRAIFRLNDTADRNKVVTQYHYLNKLNSELLGE